MSNLIITPATDQNDYAVCIQIRTTVFVHGQNVPATREIDGSENSAHHYLGRINDEPAGTVRWRVSAKNPNMAKIERIAVLSQFRGQGAGRALVKYAISEIKKNPSVTRIILGAQDQAIPFYQGLGFEIFSDKYMDGGGIPHHDMELILAA